MAKEKKTAVMTVRMPPSTKAVIDRVAEKHDWTPSKLAEKILTDWAQSAGADGSPDLYGGEACE